MHEANPACIQFWIWTLTVKSSSATAGHSKHIRANSRLYSHHYFLNFLASTRATGILQLRPPVDARIGHRIILRTTNPRAIHPTKTPMNPTIKHLSASDSKVPTLDHIPGNGDWRYSNTFHTFPLSVENPPKTGAEESRKSYHCQTQKKYHLSCSDSKQI